MADRKLRSIRDEEPPGHTTHTYILQLECTQCAHRSLRSSQSNHACPAGSSNLVPGQHTHRWYRTPPLMQELCDCMKVH